MSWKTKLLYCMGSLAGWGWLQLAGATAANGATYPTNLQAEVVSITEHRGSESRCNIMLKFTGEALATKQAIFKVRVTKATDDTGSDLTLPGEPDSGGSGTSGGFTLAAVRGWHELRPVKTRYASLRLAGASRSARTITELEGEVELFGPTIENGGVVIIEDFRRQPGSPLQNAMLRKFGVTLTYLTKESYEAAKIADRARTAASGRMALPSDDQADSLFPGILGEPGASARNYVVLELNDPQRLVTSFAFVEEGKQVLPVTQKRSGEDMMGFYFGVPAPEKLAVFVYVAVPEALEKASFRVRNIALP
jgi:hypothetical protein